MRSLALALALLALEGPALAVPLPGGHVPPTASGARVSRSWATDNAHHPAQVAVSRSTRVSPPVKRQAFRPEQRDIRPGGLLGRSGTRSAARRATTRLVSAFAEVRASASAGHVSVAASRFVQLRRALGPSRTARRVRREVASNARRLADERSQAGDIAGTREALGALHTLRQARELGWFQRWRARRVERRAFDRAFDHATRAEQEGSFASAAEQIGFAGELRGTGNRRVSRAARGLYDRSLKTAKQLARRGDPEGTMQVLEAAGMVASSLGRQARLAEAAESLMATAIENSLPLLTQRAQDLVRAHRPEEAAAVLSEALSMQQGTGIAPSRRVRRQQERLARTLAAHLRPAEPPPDEVEPEPEPEDEPGWVRRGVRTATVNRVQ